MAGASLGRLIGEIFGLAGYHTSPGSYALIGAAGMLGGVCRMTISITVIVVESTGNVTEMLPIAITIMLAKVVGDFFNSGIYDIHIEIKRYPFLPDTLSPERSVQQASDVMASGVRTVCELEQVGTLVKLLRTTSHHGFPVTKSGGGGGVLGIILRDQLITILAKRQFEMRRAASPTLSPHLGLSIGMHAGPSSQAPPLTADDFLRPWTQTTIDQIFTTLSADDLLRVVNLRPYVNEAALVTLRTTSLRRVSRLFLSMGLRHLLVVESCPKVVGIITRKDLLVGAEHSTAESRRAGLMSLWRQKARWVSRFTRWAGGASGRRRSSRDGWAPHPSSDGWGALAPRRENISLPRMHPGRATTAAMPSTTRPARSSSYPCPSLHSQQAPSLSVPILPKCDVAAARSSTASANISLRSSLSRENPTCCASEFNGREP
uniref:Chloride channel protein n=1 Tax=Haptolina brevifila TaxID=156173 RepID=A0A7S2GNI2_9EUKA